MLCKPKRFGRFLVRAGDLKHRIKIQTRDLKPATVGVDFKQNFTDLVEVWAAIETPSAKTIFDGINTTENVTHIFYIRFVAGIEPKNNWILHDGERFTIVQTIRVGRLKEFLRIDTNIKGDVTKPASAF